MSVGLNDLSLMIWSYDPNKLRSSGNSLQKGSESLLHMNLHDDEEDINLRLDREIQRDSLRQSISGNIIPPVNSNQYGTNLTGASAFEDENLLE